MSALRIDVALMRACVIYDPESGLFTWRHRAPETFELSANWSPETLAANWNSRFAGKQAFAYRRDLRQPYLSGRINGVSYRAHRVAFALGHGHEPQGEIDHINGDGGDNRLANLRCVDAATNARNKQLYSNSTSGHIGVSWEPRKKRWQAVITEPGGRRRLLGLFLEQALAVAAYEQARAALGFHPNHGRTAPLTAGEV